MKRKILWAFLIIWLILTAYLLFLSNKWASAATPSYAASSAVTTDNFAELLRETLQKNPDLLLSVLRENSEAVLDIAQEGSNQRRHKSLIAQWKAELNQPKEVDIKDRPFRGAADAPVTIVAYSDFTCPYCQQAAGTMEKVLKENQGKIKYVFKHFPLETTGVARLAAEYHVAAARQMDPHAAVPRRVVDAPAATVADRGEQVLAQMLAALRAAAALDDVQAAQRQLRRLAQLAPRLALDFAAIAAVGLLEDLAVDLEPLALLVLQDAIAQQFLRRRCGGVAAAGQLPAQ